MYHVGLGLCKLFAPFLPHITEEIYHLQYKDSEGQPSIHVSDWPEPILVDKEKENSGELVKNYISQVRSWKSEQGIALNASMNTFATYASDEMITKLKTSELIIISTLKYPESHRFISCKPDIEEKIVSLSPNFSNLGPKFKKDSN